MARDGAVVARGEDEIGEKDDDENVARVVADGVEIPPFVCANVAGAGVPNVFRDA